MKKLRKILSVLLCFVMLVGMLPVSALATDDTPDEPPTQTEQQSAECQHTGGSATCKALAICDNCKQSYGEYAAHSGGTATCTTLAVCETCGEGYGALAEHSYSEGVCTACNGADPNYVPPCEHSGGTATCTALAVCETCGEAYGALAEHSYSEGVCTACNGADPEYIPPCEHSGGTATCTENGICTACGEVYMEALGHSGGEATCTAQAVCTVCAAAYGELADHSYDNGVCSCGEVCAHAEYADGKCTLCGAAQPEVVCTCESTDPGEHAPFCDLYVRTNEPCLCVLSCAEEGLNDWCETCWFEGVDACTGGEEAPIPYVTEGSCGDGVTYTLDDAGVLTISGTGAMQNWNIFSAVPWYDTRASITTVTIGDGVTSIGNWAFYDCSRLINVEIPNSVTSIGKDAFRSCGALTSVVIPGFVTSIGDRAFLDCSSLTKVEIPHSVKSIGKEAFGYCKSLKNVTIGNSVESIGEEVFYRCSSLTKVEIPHSVKSIGKDAFGHCKSLKNVTIGNSVESIGDHAFFNCSSLTNVEIPDSVKSIGKDAFGYCTSLKNVTIGNSVESIGEDAFCNCSSLTSVEIPDSVTSIGDGAFERCTALTSVTAPCKCTVDGQSLYDGNTLLYTFNDGVTVTLAEHKAVNTGSCVCGYNPIAFVTVTGDPTSWVYAPDAAATLTANVAPTNLSNTSYVWKAGDETVPNETSSTLTLTGLNVGDHSYTCTVTVDGYTKTSEAFTVSVSKADSTVTAAPTERSLTYSGEGQNLIDPGTASGGTLQYSLDGKSYSETIPQGTDVGYYTVYYKVVGDRNHNDTAGGSVTTTIAPKSIADCSVSLSENDFTYSGSAPALNVNAVNNDNPLMKGTDYELGSVEKNAGSYTVTVTGKGNYTGTVELHYTIRKSISSIRFNGFDPDWAYIGEEFANPMASHLTITGASYDDVRFTWYKDGEPIYGNPIDAGTYKVVAEIPESENTSRSEALADNIIVKPRIVYAATMKLEKEIYDYDGKAKTPAVTVKDADVLIPESEYTVSYSNNINAGTATVTITDKPGGNYIVNGSAQFTIKPRVITVSGITAMDKVYDGSTRANLGDGVPSYSNIPEGEDPQFVIQVELSYDSAAAGEDKPISIKFVYVGVADGYNAQNYVLVTDKIYADIRPKDISVAGSCEFSLAETGFVYSGKAPELTVTGVDSSVGNTTLTENADYTVGAAQINAGSHKLTVTGKGNYTGTRELDYSITARKVSVTGAEIQPVTYDPDGYTLNVTDVKFDGVVEGENPAWTASAELTGTNAAGRQDATVTVTLNDSNYTLTTAAYQTRVTINKAAATVTAPPNPKTLTYNGEARDLIDAGKVTGGEMHYSLDGETWSETIPQATKAGDYTVQYKAKGDDNHSDSEVYSITATVNRRPVTASVSAVDRPYDGTTAVGFMVTIPDVLEGDTVTITGLTGAFSDANAGENKQVTVDDSQVTISGTNSENYDVQIPKTTTATITKSNPRVTLLGTYQPGKVYDGQSVSAPTADDLQVTGATQGEVVFTWYQVIGDNSVKLPSAPVNAGRYYVVATVPESANTNASSESNSEADSDCFEITKASASASGTELTVTNRLAKRYTVDLTELLPALETGKSYGDVSYTVAAYDLQGYNSAAPTINDGVLTVLIRNYDSTQEGDLGRITISVTSDNYTVSNAIITVKRINRTAATITGVTAASGLTYTGNAQSGYTGTPTVQGYTGTFDVTYTGTGNTTYGPNTTAPANAGTYSVKIAIPETHETLTGETTLNFTIAKAAVTITAEDKTAAEGDAKPAFTYTVTGLKGTDKLTTAPTMTCAVDMSKPGDYAITPGNAQAGDNYSITYVAGKLTVKQKHNVKIADTTNGTVTANVSKATEGTEVAITITPRRGYKLSTLVVKDAAGKSRAVSTDNDGKYYFTMPDANVTVKATFSRISTATADPTNPKTGDDFEVIFWSGMMMTSLFGVTVLVLGKKKYYQK